MSRGKIQKNRNNFSCQITLKHCKETHFSGTLFARANPVPNVPAKRLVLVEHRKPLCGNHLGKPGPAPVIVNPYVTSTYIISAYCTDVYSARTYTSWPVLSFTSQRFPLPSSARMPFTNPVYSVPPEQMDTITLDRKSTRLNSSHVSESRMPSSA